MNAGTARLLVYRRARGARTRVVHEGRMAPVRQNGCAPARRIEENRDAHGITVSHQRPCRCASLFYPARRVYPQPRPSDSRGRIVPLAEYPASELRGHPPSGPGVSFRHLWWAIFCWPLPVCIGEPEVGISPLPTNDPDGWHDHTVPGTQWRATSSP